VVTIGTQSMNKGWQHPQYPTAPLHSIQFA
jgi:hypothetical protein